MLKIAITQPHFIFQEASRIADLLEGDIDLLHLRKPEAKEEEVAHLIEAIPERYRGRIIIHNLHQLAIRYHLGGIHLNDKHPFPPKGYSGSISRSCHTLDEVKRYKEHCNYLFLSPIYNSISKQGYSSAFTREELTRAKEAGIIDHRVIALGGVTRESFSDLQQLGFGGGAMLGCIW
ncbi:MAG: thiamine phosphate synthase [Bacteroides sp.]|nr:thiamine phosphate synthase [Bacteroides sp.]